MQLFAGSVTLELGVRYLRHYCMLTLMLTHELGVHYLDHYCMRELGVRYIDHYGVL